MTDHNDYERRHRESRREERHWEPEDRMRSSGRDLEESRHWREDDRRNPYDQGRPAMEGQSSDSPRRRGGGGWSGAQFGDWDSGVRRGGAVGSQLYGGYGRHGAGQSVSQSSYGGHDDYGYGQSSYSAAGSRGRGQDYPAPERDDWRGRGEYEAHGYAPGSQIWDEQRGGYGQARRSDNDHDPDYRHWREQQMRGFDEDYAAWRNERREKFSSDFDTWRRNRPRNDGRGPQVEADNPIVGDVSDGGTGDLSKKKN